MKVYVVMSSFDYEGNNMPSLITADPGKAIRMIRDFPAPNPTETYEVYEYTLEAEETYLDVAMRQPHQKLWVHPDFVQYKDTE